MNKKRSVALPAENVTTDLSELTNDEEIELIVNNVSGLEASGPWLSTAAFRRPGGAQVDLFDSS